MNIKEHLEKNGIKPSLQRMKIYQYLHENRVHPTIDMIYHDLSENIPTLSKTTIYNNLKLFLEKGVARIVTIEEKTTRYDANTSLHGHAKCVKCGQVIDININTEQMKGVLPENFEILENHINFTGICKNCNQ